MITHKTHNQGSRTGRGISLIIVLILLIIIGITASTAMRNASSEQRATNNQRMEATALQYAEAALRYCEAQMKLPVAGRADASLKGTIPGPLAPASATSGWTDTATWTGSTGRASGTRTTVPDAVVKEVANNNTVLLSTFKRPECVVETETGLGTVITARGFSTDYAADSNGSTTSGAVVWLQSFTP